MRAVEEREPGAQAGGAALAGEAVQAEAERDQLQEKPQEGKRGGEDEDEQHDKPPYPRTMPTGGRIEMIEGHYFLDCASLVFSDGLYFLTRFINSQ